MKNFNAITILLLIAIPFLNSCCKKCQDPSNWDCENYDPCYTVKPISASFKMFETLSISDKYWQNYETDTLGSGDAKFVADIKDAEYKWEIGAGTYDTKSVSLSFSGLPDSTVIPITLIVKKQPDKGCNPNDDGIDTVTRKLVIRRECKLFPIGGVYRFQGSYKDSPKDTFTMSFYYDYTLGWSIPNVIENLPKGYTFRETSAINFGYRQISFSNRKSPSVSGRAFVKPNDSIEVNFGYSFNAGDQDTIKTFLGKRIR